MPLHQETQSRLVAGVAGGAFGFVTLQRDLDLRRKRRAVREIVGDPARRADQRRGQDRALQAGGIARGIFDRDQPAPGMAEDDAAVDLQRRAQGVHLGDEALDRPVALVARLVRVAAIELVVEDDGALFAEPGKRQEVVVRAAGPAVNGYERYALRPEMTDTIHAPPNAPARRIGIAGPFRAGRGDAGSQHAHLPPLWSLAAVLAAKCAANMAVSVLSLSADRLRCRESGANRSFDGRWPTRVSPITGQEHVVMRCHRPGSSPQLRGRGGEGGALLLHDAPLRHG